MTRLLGLISLLMLLGEAEDLVKGGMEVGMEVGVEVGVEEAQEVAQTRIIWAIIWEETQWDKEQHLIEKELEEREDLLEEWEVGGWVGEKGEEIEVREWTRREDKNGDL